MVEFKNKTDQFFLKKLNELSNNIELNLATFLSECILTNQRGINLSEKGVELFFNATEDSPENFIKNIHIIVSLIEILKKENLIFVHVNPKILSNQRTNKPNSKDSYMFITNNNNL